MTEDLAEALAALRAFNYEHIYSSTRVAYAKRCSN